MILQVAIRCAVLLAAAALCRGAEPDAGAAPEPWIAGLAADEFKDREKASSALARWAELNPEQALERFFHEAIGNHDPEVRFRCRELLRGAVLEEFRRHGEGYVGIQMGRIDIPLDNGRAFGVQVIDVVADTPAEKAGLKVNDVITALDGRRWENPGAADGFQNAVMSRRPGELVTLTVRRPGAEQLLEFEVKLARRPEMPNNLWLWQGGIMPQAPDPRELQRDEEERFFRNWYARRLTEFKDTGR